tara:strand:+ start:1717 stop:2364 length:648 start_codon:yes stop_codon:yes gene_type:complete
MENFTRYIGPLEPQEYIAEGRAIDLFVAYRFLRILTTPWEDQDAFEHGIIDKDGKLLRKHNTLKTPEEKASFTLLHRLIFNLKRILHKIPLVKSKLGTYATALFLLKQHMASNTEQEKMIEVTFSNWLVDNGYINPEDVAEEVIGLGETLPKGRYKLIQDIFTDKSEIRGKIGDIVLAFSDVSPTDDVLGKSIFKVVHQRSKEEIYVSLEDLENA